MRFRSLYLKWFVGMSHRTVTTVHRSVIDSAMNLYNLLDKIQCLIRT